MKAYLHPQDRHRAPAQLILKEPPVHRGGEGEIYLTADKRFVIKIYHRGNPEKLLFLQQIINIGDTLTEAEKQLLCFPLARVIELDGRSVVGCLTRRIPSPPFRELVDLIFSPKQAAVQFNRGQELGRLSTPEPMHSKGCRRSSRQGMCSRRPAFQKLPGGYRQWSCCADRYRRADHTRSCPPAGRRDVWLYGARSDNGVKRTKLEVRSPQPRCPDLPRAPF